jgi:hypothetical protein
MNHLSDNLSARHCAMVLVFRFRQLCPTKTLTYHWNSRTVAIALQHINVTDSPFPIQAYFSITCKAQASMPIASKPAETQS